MNFRSIILLAVLAALGLALFSWFQPILMKSEPRRDAAPAEGGGNHPNHHPQAPTSSSERPDPDDPRLTRLPDGRVLYHPSVEASRAITRTTSAEESLAVISQILDQYRYIYQSNPIGENSEITGQLLGNNPRKIIFIASDCMALRGKELSDPEGTPLFFHALSASRMDMVSAGPDLELWTDDDISTGSEHPDHP